MILYAHNELDEQHHDGNGDDEDADEVDDDTGLNHLRQRHITRGVDNGVRRG